MLPEILIKKLEELNWYQQFSLGEEIPTCPYCSSRTDIILDLGHTMQETQILLCFNSKCEFIFYACKDDFEYAETNPL